MSLGTLLKGRRRGRARIPGAAYPTVSATHGSVHFDPQLRTAGELAATAQDPAAAAGARDQDRPDD